MNVFIYLFIHSFTHRSCLLLLQMLITIDDLPIFLNRHHLLYYYCSVAQVHWPSLTFAIMYHSMNESEQCTKM